MPKAKLLLLIFNESILYRFRMIYSKRIVSRVGSGDKLENFLIEKISRSLLSLRIPKAIRFVKKNDNKGLRFCLDSGQDSQEFKAKF